METIEQLRERVKLARKEKQENDEEKRLKRELFTLNHGGKIAFFNRAKGGLTHMGKNAIAMVKSIPTKKKKKKRGHPSLNFNAFR